MPPSKRQVRLQILRQNADAITQACAQGATLGVQAGSSSSAAAVQAEALPAAAGACETETNGSGERLYKLGGNKFASVSEYKGQPQVGLREYYEKDGAWAPGRRGINLTIEQFSALCRATEVRLDSFGLKHDVHRQSQMLVCRDGLARARWFFRMRCTCAAHVLMCAMMHSNCCGKEADHVPCCTESDTSAVCP